MQKVISKAGLLVASIVSILGASSGNVKAATSDISAKSPLYLELGNNINSSGNIVVCDHESHESHESHMSHESHSSGY
jgi:hypothetical protein